MPRTQKTNIIHKDDLTVMFVKSSSNYFGNVPGIPNKPHLHITGTTSALHKTVTISSFSYTTVNGGRENIRLTFNRTNGYSLLSTRWYDGRFNDLIRHVNSFLYTRNIP